MSRENETSGMSMTTTDLPYELGVDSSYSNVGVISYSYNSESRQYSSGTELNSIVGLDLDNGSSGTFDVVGGAENVAMYYTDGSNDSIKWRLAGTSNELGIGPDSGGPSSPLTFYVIPKQTGSLDATFSIEIDGYTAVEAKNPNGTYDITSVTKIVRGQNNDASKAMSYLDGHILFFSDIESDGEHLKNLIDPTSFKLSDLNGGNPVMATENVAIPVTIYWKWINTFGQMVLFKNENPAKKEPVSTDTDTMSAIRNYVIDHPEIIFKDVSNPVSLMTDEDEFDSVTTAGNVKELSLGYNKADQEVGIQVDYVLINLTGIQ